MHRAGSIVGEDELTSGATLLCASSFKGSHLDPVQGHGYRKVRWEP